MTPTKRSLLLAALALLPLAVPGLVASCFAHGTGIFGTGSFDEVAGELAAVFGPETSFSATALMVEKDEQARASRDSEIKYFLSDGKRLRIERDLATLKVAGAAPSYVDDQIREGTARTVTIADTERRARYVIYPTLESYVEIIDPSEPRGHAHHEIERRETGTESIEGRTCKRYEITVKEGNEEARITTWEPADEKSIPLQIRTVHIQLTTTLSFRQVSRSKPDQALFVPPAGYRRFTSFEELRAFSRNRPKQP